MTTSRKKATSEASSSGVFPAHFFASAETAAPSSRYTPMAVNLMKLPPISSPRTPSVGTDKLNEGWGINQSCHALHRLLQLPLQPPMARNETKRTCAGEEVRAGGARRACHHRREDDAVDRQLRHGHGCASSHERELVGRGRRAVQMQRNSRSLCFVYRAGRGSCDNMGTGERLRAEREREQTAIVVSSHATSQQCYRNV